MAWTTKSRRPQVFGERVEHGIHRCRIGHVAGQDDLRAEVGGQGSTRFFSASP